MHNTYEDEYTSEDEPPQGMRRILALYMKWGGAAVSVALLCLFVLWSYRLGVRDAAEIPVIRALDGPVRVQPENPGGEVAANQGLEVNEILAGDEAQIPQDAQLAPATLTLTEEDIPAEPETETAAPEEGVDTAALSEEPEREEEPEQGEDAPEDISNAPVQEVDIGALVASVLEEEDAVAEDDNAETEVATLSIRPRLRATAGPLGAPAPAAVRESVLPGTLLVQLGAFDTREIAGTQWSSLLETHGDLLGTRERLIQRVDQNGRVFFRLRVLGFSNRNDQNALCEALGARSVDCIPVTAR